MTGSNQSESGNVAVSGEERAATSRNSRTGSSSRIRAADLMLGAAAGAVGVWVMDRVGWFMYNNEDPAALQQEHQARPGSVDVAHAAVQKFAILMGHTRPPEQPNAAGIAVHYALGVVPGALYGVLRNRVPALRAGGGAVYGLALFAVMDETAAPLLGIASGPTSYPWQAHARGLIAHLVLGVTTETLLRVVNNRTS